MRLKFIGIIVLMFGAALLIGWWLAGVNIAKTGDVIDPWDSFKIANIEAGEFNAITERLKRSDIFPLSREEANIAEAASKIAVISSEPGLPAFPTIVGSSVLNGEPHIHLLLADDSFLKARSGDSLESGWKLKTVDLKRVLAVYGEDEREFFVTNYDRQSESDTKDGAGDKPK